MVTGWNGDGQPSVSVTVQTGFLTNEIEKIFDKAGTLDDFDNGKKIATALAKTVGMKVKKVDVFKTKRGHAAYIDLAE